MKKKGIIGFFIASVVSVSIGAQTIADSVKISLQTSPGAEIAIDGDVSSTNLMRTRVPVGKHTVTVTYGTSYQKEYEIDVDATHTEFEFLIDGQLTVKTVPGGARVLIDGMERGKAPLTVNVLGSHNIKLVPSDRVSYFDLTDRFTVNPFQQLEQSYTLRKRPPRTYGMVLFNYMPISGSTGLGVTLACVKRWGMYLRGTISLDGADKPWPSSKDLLNYYKPMGPGYYKRSGNHYWDVSIGFMVRTCKYLYVYAGAGCSRYSTEYKRQSEEVDGTSYYNEVGDNATGGVTIDCGIVAKWKALLLQGGYTRQVWQGFDDDGNKFGSVYFGIGITIHKQKKDK